SLEFSRGDPRERHMAQVTAKRRPATSREEPGAKPSRGWSELWQKEDWWAVWLGFGNVIVAIVAFLAGGTIKPIAVKPVTWDTFATLGDHFAAAVAVVSRPARAVADRVRHQRLGNGLEARRVPSLVPGRVCDLARHLRHRTMEAGGRLQSRAAPRC